MVLKFKEKAMIIEIVLATTELVKYTILPNKVAYIRNIIFQAGLIQQFYF